MYAKTLFVLAAALGAVSAAPTYPSYPKGSNVTEPSTTTYTPPSKTEQTRVTHTVVVGRGGLKFDPDNVVAQIGEVVEWHFTPKNHSLVQSSFGKPCVPKDGDFFNAGFFPVKEGQSDEVFQIEVVDDKPIWYYCAQNAGAPLGHCQAGMVGVINQKFDTPFTLAKHRELAAQRTEPAVVPQYIQGGWRIPNPNPLSGF
jgi:plastocyanin